MHVNKSYVAALWCLLLLLVMGCASTSAPRGWLPDVDEAQQNTNGAWIVVRVTEGDFEAGGTTRRGATHIGGYGELIAVAQGHGFRPCGGSAPRVAPDKNRSRLAHRLRLRCRFVRIVDCLGYVVDALPRLCVGFVGSCVAYLRHHLNQFGVVCAPREVSEQNVGRAWQARALSTGNAPKCQPAGSQAQVAVRVN